MQQKSTQKILLFSVAAQKVEKIKALCKTLGISVQQVEKIRLRTEARCDSRNNRIQKRMVQDIAEQIFRRSFWSFQVLIHHKWIFFWRNIRRQVSNQSDVRLS